MGSRMSRGKDKLRACALSATPRSGEQIGLIFTCRNSGDPAGYGYRFS
jgi:hypothetical protein